MAPPLPSTPAINAAPTGVRSLRPGTLGLRHAIVISVAVMSPAASIFFNTIPQAGVVGAAIPFCFVVGFVVALLVAHPYSELSRELPSSGSAYTFVTEGLVLRWGFLTGWIGLIALALGAAYTFVLMSGNLQTLMQRWLGVNLHWSVYLVAGVGIIFAICYLGIRQSLTLDLGFLAFEIGICLVLAALVLLRVGQQGGLTAAPFSLSALPPGGDLTAGIVLAILSFIGFETAAALGEETRTPHRNIPRAVFGSMIVVGLFYVVMAYVATVGYGPSHMVSGYANDFAPFDTITRRFAGARFAAVIDAVGVLSYFGAALAIVNGGARILYSVGRDGLLPGWMAWTHRTRHTPSGAIATLCVLGLAVGFGLGMALSTTGAFLFLGTLDAIFVVLIYVLVNAACALFFWRMRRAQFRVVRHGVLPGLGALVTTVIVVAALTAQQPGALSYVPYVVGAWLALGLLLLVVLRKQIARA